MITIQEFEKDYGHYLTIDDLPLDAIVHCKDGTIMIIECLIPKKK
jgi:hypothetical protein